METLEEISNRYLLDKNISSGYHNYIPAYTELFDPVRSTVRNVLEIGIGSVENNEMVHVAKDGYRTGNSLRCWRDFFYNAEQIYGMDLFAHPELDQEDKIKTFIGDQNNIDDLQRIVNTIGKPLDIIIDDGSHQPGHQAGSFRFLCNYLAKGGIYAIEDIDSPYIDMFKDLSIFGDFKETILENFEVQFFDSRQKGGLPDDFIISFKRKSAVFV